ncbi:MAG: hypothetical protein OXP09_07500 [Gammaproteobacteria bacterium]|nr:hypothetical protein [Gammaproteobacteria bacterium]
MNNLELEVWLRMYEEQVRHARHHETLRTQSTNVIIVLSAAALAFFSSENISTGQHSMLMIVLIVANIYGVVMSMKHYERNRLHLEVAARYRSLLSRHSGIQGKTLNEERKIGRQKHRSRFAIVGKVRAHWLWYGLHVAIAAIFLILLFDST